MKYTDRMKHKIWLIFSVVCLLQTPIIAQYQERVYLQTDKQLYLSGELLWLKLYTTDTAGRLQTFSKIGYVELIRDSIPEVQIKLDIQHGTGVGWMELPVMLPTGYYRLIAYTRYMRNEGADVFFEKTIAIVNPVQQNDVLYSDETNTPFTYLSYEKNNPPYELSADKSSYTKRDKGHIYIKGLPAENISLGISIAGLDPSLESTLTIDQWKNQLAAQRTSVVDERYLPEYEGAIIDGVLIDLETGAPAADDRVTSLLSFPGKEIQLFAGQPFPNGDVSFYTQCVTGKEELTTTAIAATAKKFRIDIQSPYALHNPTLLPILKPDSIWLNYLTLRNLSVQVTYSYIADSLSKIRGITSCTHLYPQKRYNLDDYTRFQTMEEVFIEFITFARIRRTGEGRRFSMTNERYISYSDNILVLLDNIPIVDHELMASYNPLSVKTIDMHFGQYVFGSNAYGGIIAFYTYNNDYRGISLSGNTQIFDYEGTQPYRFFYAPDYDDTTISSPLPDFRHTLLWDPLIQSNSQKELSIPFTTSDMPGTYLITIEGVGENGTIVRTQHSIVVD